MAENIELNIDAARSSAQIMKAVGSVEVTLSEHATAGNTTPASDHDAAASALSDAVMGVGTAVLGDADALENAVAGFMAVDKARAAAASVLGAVAETVR